MMFLTNVKKIVSSYALVVLFATALSGCSVFNKMSLFDRPANNEEVALDAHHDLSSEKTEEKTEAEVAAASDEVKEEVAEKVENQDLVKEEKKEETINQTSVSAGPVVKGLVADIKRRAYDDQKTRKAPTVIGAIEEEPVSEKQEKVEAETTVNDEPPAPKSKPVIEVSEEKVGQEKKVVELKETVVENKTSTKEVIETDEAKNTYYKETAPVSVEEKHVEETQFFASKTENRVSSVSDTTKFPGLLPLPEDNFDINILSADDSFMDNTAFDFYDSSSDFGHFDTIVVDGDIGTQPLSKYNLGGSVISYLGAIIYHEHGRSDVDAKNLNKIAEIAKTYKNKRAIIRVVGHASSRTADLDPVNHVMANFTMSLQRARSVAKALIDYGVLASDIYVGAVSDSEPIYYEVMPAGEAKNRRTEIYVEYQ